MRFFIICFAILLYSLPSLAQGQGDANFILSVYRGERKAYIQNGLDIEPCQISKFNKIYSKYEEKRKVLDEKHAGELGACINKRGTQTAEENQITHNHCLAYEKDCLKLQKDFCKKLKKLLGAEQVIAFEKMAKFIDEVNHKEISKILPADFKRQKSERPI